MGKVIHHSKVTFAVFGDEHRLGVVVAGDVPAKPERGAGDEGLGDDDARQADDDDDERGDWGGRAGEGEPHRTSVQMSPVTEIRQWRADASPVR